MNRRQLAFIVILNALVSLAIALVVVWVAEARRPDPEELAALGVAPVTQPVAGSPDLPPTATSAMTQPAAEAPAAPTLAVEAPVQAAGEPEIYIVQAGDSLGGIADKLGVTMAELVEANNLDNPDFLFTGQRLVVPGTGPVPTPTSEVTLGTTGLQIRTISGVGNLGEEYVEVVNDTDLSFNLQGWKVARRGGPEYTFGDLLVFPGGSVRLYSGSGVNTTIARYWTQSAPVWSSGATALLTNAQGEAVAEYTVP